MGDTSFPILLHQLSAICSCDGCVRDVELNPGFELRVVSSAAWYDFVNIYAFSLVNAYDDIAVR